MFRGTAALGRIACLLLLSACGTGGAADDAGGSGGSGGGGGPPVCDPNNPPPCNVDAAEYCPDPPITWSMVEPIFTDHCVRCHNGNGEQWALTDFAHVAAWYAEIRAIVLDCSMPPPEECDSIKNWQRERILTWIRCGTPE